MSLAIADEIAELVAAGPAADKDTARRAFGQLRAALSSGEARAAEPDPSAASGWRVNTWVKQGILLGFRFGDNADASIDHGGWPFFDKDTLPLKRLSLDSRVRLVPGGSTVRDGAFIGPALYLIAQDYLAKQFPEYWYFGIGALLILVVLFARGGVLGLTDKLSQWLASSKPGSSAKASAR